MKARIALTQFLAAAVLCGQPRSEPVNPGLEEAGPDGVPTGWFVPQSLRNAGNSAEWKNQGCHSGSGCALLTRPSDPSPNTFSNLMQNIDARPLRGKRVLFRAAVRVEGSSPGDRAQLWFRVDLAERKVGFFDNMGRRPITSPEWKIYEINADIDDDAEGIAFGIMGIGQAKVWFDSVTFEVVSTLQSGPEVDAAKEELSKIYQQLDAGMASGKVTVLESILLPDSRIGNTMMMQPAGVALEQLKKHFDSGARIKSKSEITSVRIAGSETTVRLRQTAEMTSGTQSSKMEGSSVDVWSRKDGVWKLITSTVLSQRPVQPPVDSAQVKRLAAALKERATPLTTAEPGKPDADLQAFGKAVGDARLVALGEATHGTREIFQMKHRLFEYLVREKGFTVFAFEANWPESAALDRYVRTGEGDPRLGLRDMYFWTWQTEEVLALAEWMRNFNKAPGDHPILTFTSFDMQVFDVAMARVVEFARKVAPGQIARVEAGYAKATARKGSSQIPDPAMGEAAKEAQGVLDWLQSQRESFISASSKEAYRDALQAARIVVQAVTLRSTNSNPSYRDQMMASNVEWLANEAYPGQKIVLWAHNGHVMKQVGEGGYRPMGAWLAERLGAQLYVLGFAIHRGTVRAIAREETRTLGLVSSEIPPAAPGSGTAVLSATGYPIFFADVRGMSKESDELATWLKNRQLFRECGAIWFRNDAAAQNMRASSLSENYDGLIFFENSSAAVGLDPR